MFDALVAIATLSFAAFLVFVLYVVAEAVYYQGRLAKELQKELGFQIATPYIRCGLRTCGVITIFSLSPGGAFAKAGFREGDIIIGPGISGLYKMLHRSRGSGVRFNVVEGGNGLPLDQRPKREITVLVPSAKGG